LILFPGHVFSNPFKPLAQKEVKGMLQLIFFALCIAGLLLLVNRIAKKEEPPADTYVCDVCGEKHCTCRKEERS
jgi:Na+/H+-dicarboxylate symporter